MSKNYQTVLPKIRELSLLNSAQALMGWDQEVTMPQGNAMLRGEQMAALASVVHHKLTDPALGEGLRAAATDTDLNPFESCNVRETLRSHERSIKVPAALIEELTKLTSQATHVWVEARKKSDFKTFAPWLEKIIDIDKQIAENIGYAKVPYDALLDEYDPGATVDNVSDVLLPVRDKLVPIVKALGEATQKPDLSILQRHYPVANQEKVCREIATAIGFDMNCGRLDVSAHPFCSGTSPRDVRLTTRYDANWFPGAFFGVVHEAGHGIYEQGLNPDYVFTPAGDSCWLSIHESQSRFWENMVGRNRAFWDFYFPKLKTYFPEALSTVTEDAFYGAINSVQPSLIRVEADEVTYGLHVILRFEIEQALFSNQIKVADLPAVWNEKVKKYFGLTPPDDAQGVLQDIHWAHGSFGYFPTYLMGTLYSAQWAHYIRKALPMDDLLRKGQFAPIKEWLNTNIHHHGRVYWAKDLVKQVTGEALNPAYFITYLKEKFGPIYGIPL